MPDIPAISGVDDPANVRVMLLQGKQQVNAPLTGLGLQPSDAMLTALAALVTAADQGLYFTGPDAPALFTLTAAGRALIDDADATAQRATLGLGSSATKELTSWVTYTPTFTGFGTVSAVSIWSRRIGDTLHIRGKFTSGVATAVEARMTLGFNGTNGGITSDATKVASIQLAGSAIRSTAAAASFYTLIESNIGYITFGVQLAGSAALTKANGDGIAATGVVFSILAEIPIAGW